MNKKRGIETKSEEFVLAGGRIFIGEANLIDPDIEIPEFRELVKYPLHDLRVLIVDDDPRTGKVFKDALELEECAVEVARSGSDAMEWLSHQRFDAVLMDVVMPDVDGHQLFHSIKERQPSIPILLMTEFGYGNNHVLKRIALEEAEAVILKKLVRCGLLKKLLVQLCRSSVTTEMPQ
jgi:CheY-like chemotaxis protein